MVTPDSGKTKKPAKDKIMTAVRIVLVAVTAMMVGGAPVFADQPEQIEKTVQTSVETRKKTQEKAKVRHAEKDKEKAKYFQLKEEIDEADLELKRMKELVERQDAYLARQHKKLIEMGKIRQGLLPYLEELVAQMEHHISEDIPFLRDERSARLDNLKGILYDPEISLGEKFRRVYEGLRVEMEYGRSVEVTKEEITFQEETLLVNVLRIGRTAMLMQTLDGKDIALYRDGWKPLPKKYQEQIKKAIDIVQRKRPVEFVNLPVKVIAE